MRYGKEGGLVYSTEHGQMCPGCRQPQAACSCASTLPVGDGVVRVSCQRKGRGGKTVTLVRGVPLAADALAVLGKQLRAACGSGGTVKDGDIEIQGDHVDTVLSSLAALGYTVKRSGG
jgi:translation initiation factor 1